MHTDVIVLDSAQRLFQDVASIQSVLAARDEGWKQLLWSGIEQTGLNIAALPEHLDGAGMGLGAALGILRIAGNAALSTPLAETMLSGWMLGAAGLTMPQGKIAFGPSTFFDQVEVKDGAVTARLERLPFGRDCSHAVLLANTAVGLSVVLVSLGARSIKLEENLAYEPVDRVILSECPALAIAPAPAGFTYDTTLLVGSAARAMQIAGALEKMLAITIEYVTQRRAFERTISKFQVVQHSIAQLAGEVAISLSAAASAADAVESLLGQKRGFDDPELRLEIIGAKIRTASAAQKSAAIAHQLHGALGVTREHILHRLSLRALAWRDDYGNESEWAEKLGQLVSSEGAHSLWPLLAAR